MSNYSNFPTYNNNTFPIDSFNTFTLSLFNPFGLYHYTATIISPVFPEGQGSDIVAPTVTTQDVMVWCGQFFDIDDVNTTLNPLAEALIDIASDYIDVVFIGEKSYKRVVALYVGHYLEMHLRALKDEANRASFNAEDADKVKEIKMDLPANSKEFFKETISGRLFWDIYGGIQRFAGDREHSIWGGI